jgi:hypothetical protein
MSRIKRLSLVTALALAAVALTAATASADIVNSSGVYNGYVFAEHNENTGDDPTLTAGGVVISCDDATSHSDWDQTTGEQEGIDGDWDATGPANATLDFAWAGCTAAAGAQTCTVDPVHDVPVNFTESTLLAPDSEIVNTDRGQTFVNCTGGIFSCDAWSDPADGTAVVADVDSETQIITINDTVGVGGSLTCPSSGVWEARYQITTPSDPLSSTGTQ